MELNQIVILIKAFKKSRSLIIDFKRVPKCTLEILKLQNLKKWNCYWDNRFYTKNKKFY